METTTARFMSTTISPHPRPALWRRLFPASVLLVIASYACFGQQEARLKPRLDLVAGSGGTVSILMGNGDGTFQATASYLSRGGAEPSIVVGDFDGDGKLDLAVAGTAVTILIGHGDGTFHLAANFDPGSLPSWAAMGDLNGDGKTDLAVSTFADTVTVLKNTTR
jgi:hypothetical protein